jgi:hypothetical protein
MEPTLEEQFGAIQQMFGWVLKTVGEPVKVLKEDLNKPLGGDYMIDAHETDDAFTFSLINVEDVPNAGE